MKNQDRFQINISCHFYELPNMLFREFFSEKLRAATLVRFQWHILKFWEKSSFGLELTSMLIIKIGLFYDTNERVCYCNIRRQSICSQNKGSLVSIMKNKKIAKLPKVVVWKSAQGRIILENWTHVLRTWELNNFSTSFLGYCLYCRNLLLTPCTELN